MRKVDYCAPKTLKEGLSLLDQYSNQARILAGGTNLIPALKARKVDCRYIVNLKSITDLQNLYKDDEGIHIGSLVTLSDLSLIEIAKSRASSSILEQVPVFLRKIISLMGNPQVRNIATMAGNLAWASPAADSAPPLLVLDAILKVHATDGNRVVPIDELFLGPGKTCLKSNEVIAEILIPSRALTKTGQAHKFMKRKANTLAVCSAAVTFKKCNAEIVRDVRIAVGAVAPIPMRIKKAEAFVEGNRIDRKLMEDLRKIIHEEIAPITDGRSTAWFRKQVTPVLVERCFVDASS